MFVPVAVAVLSSSRIGASQLVLASEAADIVDGEGQPSSVLVHRLGSPTAPDGKDGGGAGASDQPRRELLLDQRRYANISRYVRATRGLARAPPTKKRSGYICIMLVGYEYEYVGVYQV